MFPDFGGGDDFDFDFDFDFLEHGDFLDAYINDYGRWLGFERRRKTVCIL